MVQIHSLAVEARGRAGKGSARAARREGRVPAVIYGNKETPELVTILEKDLARELGTGTFLSTLFDLKLGERTERVLPRDVHFHPVTDRPLHIDFLRIAKDGLINIAVPVAFTNQLESPGLKRGGVLNIVHHEIELRCPADRVPERLEISLAGLDVGTSIHSDALTLPEGATLVTHEKDFTVATIASPSGDVPAPEEAVPAAAAAAPAAAAPAKGKK